MVFFTNKHCKSEITKNGHYSSKAGILDDVETIVRRIGATKEAIKKIKELKSTMSGKEMVSIILYEEIVEKIQIHGISYIDTELNKLEVEEHQSFVFEMKENYSTIRKNILVSLKKILNK